MIEIHKLFKKAKKGNDKAFEKLFEPYEADIYRIAYVYVKNESDALDVLQETACKAFEKIHGLKEPAYFKTWLIKIAINNALNLLRGKQKIIYMAEVLPEKAIVNQNHIDQKILLEQVMNVLTNEEKSVILLKYYQDLPYTEVANILQIPLGTAKSICYRALKKLRIRIEKEDMYESN